jgi:hypothetical protein
MRLISGVVLLSACVLTWGCYGARKDGTYGWTFRTTSPPCLEFDQYAKEYGLEVSDFAGNGKTDSSAKDGKDAKKHVKSEHKPKVSPEVPASIAILKAQAAQACQMLNNDKITSAQYLGEMKSIRASVAGVAAKWPKK